MVCVICGMYDVGCMMCSMWYVVSRMYMMLCIALFICHTWIILVLRYACTSAATDSGHIQQFLYTKLLKTCTWRAERFMVGAPKSEISAIAKMQKAKILLYSTNGEPWGRMHFIFKCPNIQVSAYCIEFSRVSYFIGYPYKWTTISRS